MIIFIITRILALCPDNSVETLSCPDSVSTHFSEVISHAIIISDHHSSSLCHFSVIFYLLTTIKKQFYSKDSSTQLFQEVFNACLHNTPATVRQGINYPYKYNVP